ncbi:MAG: thioredoxin family protein [Candidatus Cloacimonetes bacterium]|nr:thioredoxin family protein [Candidatus Cloacimonadota bacterium]
MKFLRYLVVAVFLFLLLSCDRFEHTFKPAETVDINAELFNPLQTAFETITATDVSAVIEFYDDDYLHNNQNKTQREEFYLGLFNTKSVLNFQISILSQQTIGINDTLSALTWRLTVTNAADETVADSTFTGEKVIKRNNKWLLYGNRDICCPPVTYKQRVFIEHFTGKYCASCPEVADDLHQLQEALPNQVTYLAYHISDQMDIGNYDVMEYYAITNQPAIVIQGETKVIGHNENNYQLFYQKANQIANTNAQIHLTNLNYTITGQTMSGSVRLIMLDQNLDTNPLKLKFAIYDKVSAQHSYYPSGYPCRNVVLAKGTKALQGADFSQPVNFNLPFTGTLPDDSYLVIWVQITPDPFENNAKVYNGLESFIQTKRIK